MDYTEQDFMRDDEALERQMDRDEARDLAQSYGDELAMCPGGID